MICLIHKTKAFKSVYLPRESPRNSIFKNSRLENLQAKILENPRSVFAGKHIIYP